MILPPQLLRGISSVSGLKSELEGLNLTIDSIKDSMSNGNGNNQPLPVMAKVATTGLYSDLISCPLLFSGDYRDLTNKPIMFSGNYSDLVGKPVIPTVSYPVTSVSGRKGDILLSASDISGLATVATTNSYTDLINKPTIPTVSYPVTTVAGRKGDVVISTSDVSGLATVAKTNDYNDLLNKPSNATLRRIETYLGTTNASGNYTVVYATPFTQVPDIQPQIQNGNYNQFIKITSSTTTGFTVSVGLRSSVTIGGIEVLLAATTVVNGASIGVLVTQRI